ncbi:MAG: hypothetical protein R2762_23830 [Bryobacteraceae bacterium]
MALRVKQRAAERDGDRECHARAGRMGPLGDVGPDALGNHPHFVDGFRPENDDELLPAVAADKIACPQVPGHLLGHRLQHGISRRVAVGVVDLFEAIDIGEDDADFARRGERRRENLLQVAIGIAAVGDAGEGVPLCVGQECRGPGLESCQRLVNIPHFEGGAHAQGDLDLLRLLEDLRHFRRIQTHVEHRSQQRRLLHQVGGDRGRVDGSLGPKADQFMQPPRRAAGVTSPEIGEVPRQPNDAAHRGQAFVSILFQVACLHSARTRPVRIRVARIDGAWIVARPHHLGQHPRHPPPAQQPFAYLGMVGVEGLLFQLDQPVMVAFGLHQNLVVRPSQGPRKGQHANVL